MGKIESNVLIPGAGGAAGIGAIRSLKLIQYSGKIISTDVNPLSAGLYLSDNGYVVPSAEDNEFLSSAIRIIHKENVKIIMPTSGFDIVPYSKNKRILSEMGVIPVISDYDVIETCTNKLKFYESIKNNFDLPFTSSDISEFDDFPCIVKPIHGKGSRDIFLCNSRDELKEIFSKYHDMLIQEYLPGKEFTIDVMSDLDGNPLFAVPRERIEVKSGICTKGRIVKDQKLIQISLDVANQLGLIGPSCVQIKVDQHGSPKILEVNPRMGGATIMATYAGANFPRIIIDLVEGENIAEPTLQEISVVRYFEEVVLDDEKMKRRIA